MPNNFTQKFIEASIKGGYLENQDMPSMFNVDRGIIARFAGGGKTIVEALLDPELFKCAGKTLGWNEKHKWYPKNKNGWYYKQYGAKAKRCMVCQKDNFSYPQTVRVNGKPLPCGMNTAMHYRHQFLCEHIPSGKSPDEFFKQLLEKK